MKAIVHLVKFGNKHRNPHKREENEHFIYSLWIDYEQNVNCTFFFGFFLVLRYDQCGGKWWTNAVELFAGNSYDSYSKFRMMIKLFIMQKCHNIFVIRQKVKHQITFECHSLIYFDRFPCQQIIKYYLEFSNFVYCLNRFP